MSDKLIELRRWNIKRISHLDGRPTEQAVTGPSTNWVEVVAARELARVKAERDTMGEVHRKDVLLLNNALEERDQARATVEALSTALDHIVSKIERGEASLNDTARFARSVLAQEKEARSQ